MIRRRNHLFYPLPILGLCLEETAEGMFHRGFDRSRPAAEMAPEAITKVKESLANPRQPPHLRIGSSVFLTPSGVVPIMFHLTVSCILIKLALSLLVDKNQSDKSDKVEVGCRENHDSRSRPE